MNERLHISDVELAEQGYRVLCWTCDYSSCRSHAFDNMPKLVFSRPSPRTAIERGPG